MTMERTRGRVVVAGGSGFVGRGLVEELAARGYEVAVLSRRPGRAVAGLPESARVVGWEADWAGELPGAAGVVNLAGASIGGGRWTAQRKQAILSSRVETTGRLVDAIRALPASRRPPVLVSASGIDYAGDRGEEPVTEEAEPGDSFLAGVCVAWEDAARRAEALGVRVVLMRTAFVFGRGAPAVRLLALPFRLFVGGPLGSGRQWFPWISLEDTVRLYALALERHSLTGPVNAVAPEQVRQRELARELGRVLRRPAVFPTPAPLLRLALGEQADLLLHGQRAEPRKALEAGFEFRHPLLHATLEEALR
jgi:uncharacterized protein (TIGR01777 family)